MSRIVGFDLETTGLIPREKGARILTVGWAQECQTGQAKAVEDALPEVEALLADPDVTLVGHNLIQFDMVWWLTHYPSVVRAKLFDTRVAQSLIDEEGPNSLVDVVRAYVPQLVTTEWLEAKSLRGSHEEVTPQLLAYNQWDAEYSVAVYQPLRQRLERLGLLDLFSALMTESWVLAQMTLRGVAVNVDAAKDAGMALLEEEVALEEKIKLATGVPDLNLNSPKQLQRLLFDDLLFPILARTKKTGAPSTSTPTLLQLRAKLSRHKEARNFLDALIRYRLVRKHRSTYIEPWVRMAESDGALHPSFQVGRAYDGGTRTGRLSSSNPNLQNVPRDRNIRGLVTPREGMRFAEADYSQVELRVAAWLAQEERMLDAFSQGVDIHTATLARLEGLSTEEAQHLVDTDATWGAKRADVKSVNFLILYGGGPYQLQQTAAQAGHTMSLNQASNLIHRWMSAYPTLVNWIEDSRKILLKQGFLTNIYGQRRQLPLAVSEGPESYLGQRALRQGVNFLVQSVAARITLLSLPIMDKLFSAVGGSLLLTVHDSLLGEYPEGTDETRLKARIEQALVQEVRSASKSQHGVSIDSLPLEVDVHVNLRAWGDK